jgi:SulP family sulfate permease
MAKRRTEGMSERKSHPSPGGSNSDFLRALVPGVFSGTLVVILSVSFAALIFSGDMSGYIAQGISLAISAAIIVGIGGALFSHCSPTISMADEDTAPVYALLVSLVFASMPAGATPAEIFASAIAAILLSTIVAGCGLALLGFFKFGGLIQYLPHSVMGGYFAAVGWLLLIGGLRVATGMELNSLAEVTVLFQSGFLSGWLPVVLFVAWLLLMENRLSRSHLLPGTVLAAVIAWYALALGTGLTPQDLMQKGLLIGPFANQQAELFQPLAGLEFASINWTAVLSNLGGIGAIFMISIMSMVLSISGLGLLGRDELDMNRELKIYGLSNIASGLGGGMTGLPSYSLSSLAIEMGAPKNPWAGLLTAIICALVFIFGLDLVAYTPRFVLGALLVYLGISYLREWLLKTWHKFSRLEYLVIPIILMTAITIGFLEGMLVGLVAAVILFVIKYSQTKVIRFVATGAALNSNVDRNSTAQGLIRENGEQLLIMGLQGYLFFGTAGHVYSELADRAKDMQKERLKYAVLDFSQVTGLDASAALNFQRMAQLASRASFKLLIAGLESELLLRLEKGGFEEEYRDDIVIQADLDRAIEWCENDLLTQIDKADDIASCFDRFRPYLASDDDLLVFKGYLERREVEANMALTQQGDASRELFFMETSAASVLITDANGEAHRVRRTQQGTVFGEMGFYLGNPRTATVIADEPGIVYVLDQDALARMESRHSEIAGAFHRYMAMLISERLLFTTQSLKAVLI